MNKLSINLKKMHKLIAVLAAIFFINIAWAGTGSHPQYSDYPVAVPCKKTKPITLDLSDNKQAQVYHAKLQAAAKQPVNFAGHYVLTSWGCGAFCQKMAIIDAQTGKVYLPEPKDSSWQDHLVGWTYEKPQLDSSLLIINAQLTKLPRSNPDSLKGPFTASHIYYKWEDNQLVRLP